MPVGLLLAVISVAVVYLLFEPQYEASALLEINERPQYIAFEPKDEEISKGYFRTQMEIIRSRWIIGRAVAAIEKIKPLPEISKQPDPIDWLRKQVSVVSSNDSDVFEIKFASGNPENAALVVNTVTEQYLKAQEEEESKKNSQIVAELTKEMESREEAVRALRKQIQATTQGISGKEPEVVWPDPSSPIKSPLAELQARLVTVQVDRAMLSARIKATEEELDAAQKASSAEGDAPNKSATARLSREQVELRDATLRKAIADDPRFRQLNSQLVANQVEIERIEKRSARGKADPLYIKQQEEIAIIEKNLEALKQKLAGSIENNIPIKAAAVPLSKEEIEWRDAMVYRAIEDNAEVKLWHSLLVPKQMQLLQIETTAELGKQDPS